ncbi:MAG: hypothetical protein NPIRA06_13860 [Nitrospirales bacterium]|nr:MAG: hypothetical protein NPIRA06_13860 [Nitrospirales bacterium]
MPTGSQTVAQCQRDDFVAASRYAVIANQQNLHILIEDLFSADNQILGKAGSSATTLIVRKPSGHRR